MPLLVRLARRHALTVYISLVSTDADVIRLFEPRSPAPLARLRTLAKLTTAGLRAGLIVAPVLPGITDSITQIRDLLSAARAAGAAFVCPMPLRLYPDTKARVLPIVERRFPHLAARYRAAYGNGCDVPHPYERALRERFHRLAAAHGIVDVDHRAYAPQHERRDADQLSLFAGART